MAEIISFDSDDDWDAASFGGDGFMQQLESMVADLGAPDRRISALAGLQAGGPITPADLAMCSCWPDLCTSLRECLREEGPAAEATIGVLEGLVREVRGSSPEQFGELFVLLADHAAECPLPHQLQPGSPEERVIRLLQSMLEAMPDHWVLYRPQLLGSVLAAACRLLRPGPMNQQAVPALTHLYALDPCMRWWSHWISKAHARGLASLLAEVGALPGLLALCREDGDGGDICSSGPQLQAAAIRVIGAWLAMGIARGLFPLQDLWSGAAPCTVDDVIGWLIACACHPGGVSSPHLAPEAAAEALERLAEQHSSNGKAIFDSRLVGLMLRPLEAAIAPDCRLHDGLSEPSKRMAGVLHRLCETHRGRLLVRSCHMEPSGLEQASQAADQPQGRASCIARFIAGLLEAAATAEQEDVPAGPQHPLAQQLSAYVKLAGLLTRDASGFLDLAEAGLPERLLTLLNLPNSDWQKMAAGGLLELGGTPLGVRFLAGSSCLGRCIATLCCDSQKDPQGPDAHRARYLAASLALHPAGAAALRSCPDPELRDWCARVESPTSPHLHDEEPPGGACAEPQLRDCCARAVSASSPPMHRPEGVPQGGASSEGLSPLLEDRDGIAGSSHSGRGSSCWRPEDGRLCAQGSSGVRQQAGAVKTDMGSSSCSREEDSGFLAPKTAEPGPQGSPGGRPRSLPLGHQAAESGGRDWHQGPAESSSLGALREQQAPVQRAGTGDVARGSVMPPQRRASAELKKPAVSASATQPRPLRQPLKAAGPTNPAAKGQLGRSSKAGSAVLGASMSAKPSRAVHPQRRASGAPEVILDGVAEAAQPTDSKPAYGRSSVLAARGRADCSGSQQSGAVQQSAIDVGQLSTESAGGELVRALAELEGPGLRDKSAAPDILPRVQNALLADIRASHAIPRSALPGLFRLLCRRPAQPPGWMADALQRAAGALRESLLHRGSGEASSCDGASAAVRRALQAVSVAVQTSHPETGNGLSGDGAAAADADAFVPDLLVSHSEEYGARTRLELFCELAQRWEAAYLWPAWGRAVFGVSPVLRTCHLVEVALESRLPAVRGAFQLAGWPPGRLIAPWLACSFRGVVPEAAAVDYVALAAAMGPDYAFYFACAVLRHLERDLKRHAVAGDLREWGAGVRAPGFRTAEHVEFMRELEVQFREQFLSVMSPLS